MASVFDGIDTTNPCLVWPVLQQALYKLAAGEQTVRIKHGDFDETLTQASVADLERMVNQLKSECNAKNGGRRRFAMGSGYC